MQACPTEIFWPTPPTEMEDSGPRHISQVLQEWARRHEAALVVDARRPRPLPARPAPCQGLVLATGAIVV